MYNNFSHIIKLTLDQRLHLSYQSL